MTALAVAATLGVTLAAIPAGITAAYRLPPWLDATLTRWVSWLDAAGQVRADAEAVAQAEIDRAAVAHRARTALYRRQSRPAAVARRRRVEVAR